MGTLISGGYAGGGLYRNGKQLREQSFLSRDEVAEHIGRTVTLRRPEGWLTGTLLSVAPAAGHYGVLSGRIRVEGNESAIDLSRVFVIHPHRDAD